MQTFPVISVFGFLGVSALIVDGVGSILESNEAAKRTLNLQETREGPPQRLPEPLRKYLSEEALADVADGVVCIYVPRPERRALVFMLAAVSPGDANPVMMALIDLEQFCQPKRTVLRSAFGLTAAEADVARGVAQGQSVSEIAGALGLAVSTVRGQLKAVFAKTATRRQGELALVVARTCLLPGTIRTRSTHRRCAWDPALEALLRHDREDVADEPA